MKGWLAALAIGIALVSCSSPTLQEVISQDKNIREIDRPVVRIALDSLFDACPGLGDFWGDFDTYSIEVVPGGEFDFRTEFYGWRKHVRLTVKVREDARLIPSRYRAGGHTLRFSMGGGWQPGVTAHKDQARALCPRMTSHKSADHFLIISNMSELDKLG